MADLTFGQSAGLAGISSLMDFGASSILANSANAKSKRAAERQLWQNVYLMNLQNEYNKPVNQMKRLEEAGLNPNLVYGSGADTLSATAGRVEQAGITPSRGTLNFIEKMSMLNAMKQQEANIYRTDADTNAINANIGIAKANLRMQEAKNAAEIERIRATTDAIKADSSKKNFWSSFYQNPAETIGGFLENVGRPVVEGFWNFGRALGAKLRSDKPYRW